MNPQQQDNKPLDLTTDGLTAKIKPRPNHWDGKAACDVLDRICDTRDVIVKRLFELAEENGKLKLSAVNAIREAKGENFDPKDLTHEEMNNLSGLQISNFMRQRDLHREALPLMHKLDVLDAILGLNPDPGVEAQTVGQGIDG